MRQGASRAPPTRGSCGCSFLVGARIARSHSLRMCNDLIVLVNASRAADAAASGQCRGTRALRLTARHFLYLQSDCPAPIHFPSRRDSDLALPAFCLPNSFLRSSTCPSLPPVFNIHSISFTSLFVFYFQLPVVIKWKWISNCVLGIYNNISLLQLMNKYKL